jgi:homoserine dehydrogenase
MLYGRGAGGAPTAAAVLGDLVDAATNLRQGAASPMQALPRAVIRAIDEVRSEYYVHLDVSDRPGVLAAVAGVFAEHDVSIRSVEQEGLGDEARLIFITHEAPEAAVQATLQDLRHLDVVDRVAGLLRVIGE